METKTPVRREPTRPRQARLYRVQRSISGQPIAIAVSGWYETKTRSNYRIIEHWSSQESKETFKLVIVGYSDHKLDQIIQQLRLDYRIHELEREMEEMSDAAFVLTGHQFGIEMFRLLDSKHTTRMIVSQCHFYDNTLEFVIFDSDGKTPIHQGIVKSQIDQDEKTANKLKQAWEFKFGPVDWSKRLYSSPFSFFYNSHFL